MRDAPPGLAFDPMTEADLPGLVRWRHQQHVRDWFPHVPADVQAARQRYRSRIRGEDVVRMWVVSADQRSIGYLQAYRVDDVDDYAVRVQDPGAVAFDYLIGEPEYLGRGVGTTMVGAFLRDVLCREFAGARHLVASPDHRNAASLRVLDKVGLHPGSVDSDAGKENPEIVCTIDRAVVGG